MKKINILVWAVVIIIVIAGVVTYSNKPVTAPAPEVKVETPVAKPVEKPTVKATTSESIQKSPLGANWKLYKNSNLGFEMSIPSDAKISTDKNAVFFEAQGQNFSVGRVEAKIHGGTLDKYYYLNVKSSTTSTIAGKEAYLFSIPAYGEGGEKFQSSVTLTTQKESYFYNLSFEGDLRISDVENQIIRSFKFIQ